MSGGTRRSRRPLLSGLAFASFLLATQAPPLAAQDSEPRYLSVLRSELDAMGAGALCEVLDADRVRCRFRHLAADGRRVFPVRLLYSDANDTLYVYVPDLAHVPADDPRAPAVLRRAMELNWRLLSAKLEWNERTGELRMSTLLHTDSNFDRRAFRNLVSMLLSQVERHADALRDLASPRLEPLLD